MSRWTDDARWDLWAEVWHAIGEAHGFLAKHPNVRPCELAYLVSVAKCVGLYQGSVSRHVAMDDAEHAAEHAAARKAS